LEEQREKLEMLVVENVDLKKRALDYEDEAKRLRKQAKQLQGQLDLQDDFKLQLEKAQQELKWSETQLKSKDIEVEEIRKTISNLQRALVQ
jgi:predicted nuclease with TOPRIM domain